MNIIKFDDNGDWIKKLPISDHFVSTAKFTEMVNFMYKYTHSEQRNILNWDVVDKIIEVNGFAERVQKNTFRLKPQGEKYVVIIDGITHLTAEWQTYFVNYFLNNGFSAPVTSPLKPFAITEEQANNYQFTEKPVVLNTIVFKINNLIDTSAYQKLTVKPVADFLVDEGMLDMVRADNGRYFRRATKKGNAEGIYYKEYTASDGNVYMSNVYDKHGQFYIIDNIQKICEFNNGTRTISAGRFKGVSAEEAVIDEPEEKRYTCKDCMDYRNGGCFGADDICVDFRFAYTYSAKEVENWPDEGDATYFKRKKRK